MNNSGLPLYEHEENANFPKPLGEHAAGNLGDFGADGNAGQMQLNAFGRGAFNGFDPNLLVNGTFETDFDPVGLQMDEDVAGWHSFPDSNGERILDIEGNDSNKRLKLDAVAGRHDRIYQDVFTTSGQTYLFNFDLRGGNVTTSRSDDVLVYFDGDFVGEYRALDKWQTLSVELTGSRTGFSRLELREVNEGGNGGDGNGPLLDNMEMIPVRRLQFNNGGFEQGDLSPDQRIYHISEVPEWTTGGPVEDRRIKLRPYNEDRGRGQYYWTLDSFQNRFDRARHKVNTEDGQRYFLTFESRSPLGTTDAGNQIRVRFNNQHADTHFASTLNQTHIVSIDSDVGGVSRIDFAEARTPDAPFGDGQGPWIDEIKWYELDTDAIDASTAVIYENGTLLNQQFVNVPLQESGERVTSISFDVSARFDRSDEQAAIEDLLNVYVVSPTNPVETLLDNGTVGGAIFSLAGSQSQFPAGRVRFDGTTVTIDVSEISSAVESFDLHFQSVDTDNDDQSQYAIGAITTELGGGTSPAILRNDNPRQPGGELNLGDLTAANDITLQVENVSATEDGHYRAEVAIQSTGENTGRSVALVFEDFPSDVVLLNVSGTTSTGAPYINLRPAIPSGGLSSGVRSGFVEVLFDSPNLSKFRFSPQILSGPPNRAPVFPTISDVTLSPGGFQRIEFGATDPDGDQLTYSLVPSSEMPSVVFQGNGYLELRPEPDQIGSYQLEVEVTDGVARTRQSFNVDVVADPNTSTRISGRVLDTDESALVDVPIELGSVSTVTNSNGEFTIEFDGAPPSETLFVRGESITGPEAYPFIAEKLSLLFGRDLFPNANNVLDRPIYLPSLDLAQADTIDFNSDSIVDANLRMGEADAQLFVAAGTLIDQQGNPFNGQVSITEVPRDLTPAALPDNLIPDVVVTIQPGELVFNQPAQLTLPNRAGYAPGTLLDLWSINPTSGEFEIVGVMQVSDDGTVTETISGGIMNSSWHLPVPPSPPTLRDQTKDPTCSCGSVINVASEFELFSGARTEDHVLATYQSQGQTRGISLVYDSLRANPQQLTRFTYDQVPDWALPQNAAFGLDSRLIAELSYLDGGVTTMVPGNLPDDTRHHWSLAQYVEQNTGVFGAIKVDGRSISTGIIPYALRAGFALADEDSVFGGGATDTVNDAFVNVNSIGSVFGNGWGIAGLQTIHVAGSIADSPYSNAVLLVDGSGDEFVFRLVDGGESTFYVGPPGDFSTLQRMGDGTFRRTLTDQTVFQFDSENRLSSVTDRNGNQTQYSYNANGDIEQIVDPAGLATNFTYSQNQVTIDSPGDRRNTLVLSDDGNLIEVFNADNTSRIYGYDERFLMTSEKDERRNETTLGYDILGRLRTATRPDNSNAFYESAESKVAELASVDGDTDDLPFVPLLRELNVALAIDSNGNAEEHTLNEEARIIESRDALGELVSFVRNDDQLVTELVDANGNEIRFFYDNLGNLILTENVGITGSSNSPGIRSTDSGFPVGNSPVAVQAGDLDNDGIVDFATASNFDRNVSVVMGTENSGFQSLSPVDFSILDSVDEFLLEDLDSDGELDLLVLGNNGIAVAYGRGDGGFSGANLIRSTIGTSKIAVGDFNSDGSLDVSYRRGAFEANLELLVAGNQGEFEVVETAVDLSIIFDSPNPLFEPSYAVADIDSDGNLDIVAANSVEYTIWLGSGELSFIPQAPVQLSGFSSNIVNIEDVNNDSIFDLVMARPDQASVSISIGIGGGVFESERQFSTKNTSESLEIFDADQDGNLDVALVGSGTISLLMGEGSGDFEFAKQFAIATSNSTDIGDFNGDGLSDVVSANGSILFGDQAELFRSQEVNTDAIFYDHFGLTDNVNATDLYDIDVNNDGQLDSVAVGEWGISTRLRNDDGILVANQVLFSDANTNFRDSSISDFDNDGFLDVVVSSNMIGSIPSVKIFKGIAGGNFEEFATFGLSPLVRAELVETFDANNDGNTDFVISAQTVIGDREVAVYIGDGNGGFATSDTFLTRSSDDLVVGDLNGDNVLDIVMVGRLTSDVSVFYGLGNGEFQNELLVDVDFGPRKVQVGDIDNDGFVDIVASDASIQLFSSTSYFSVLFGDGVGFSRNESFFAGEQIRDFTLADIDDDGDLDVLTVNRSGDFSVNLNVDGVFERPTRYQISLSLGSISTGDFNSDGALDVRTTQTSFGTSRTAVVFGNGDGTFQSEERIATGVRPTAAEFVDVNGDGILDAVSANSETDDVTILLGEGSGAFAQPVHIPVGESPISLAVEDFDGDGDFDLAVANEESNSVSILQGTGTGDFNIVSTLQLGQTPTAMTVDDVNADGFADLIVSSDSGSVLVAMGMGNGSFGNFQSFSVPGTPVDVQVADFNQDNFIDIVTANGEGSELSVLFGVGDGTFLGQQIFDAEVNLASVSVDDLNNDGIPDIIAGTTESRFVILWGDSQNSFSERIEYESQFGFIHNLKFLDVNNDGFKDVFVGSDFRDGVELHLGNGSRSFSFDRILAPSVDDVVAFGFGDVNQDGTMDLFLASEWSYIETAILQPTIRSGRPVAVTAFDYDPVFTS